MERSTPTEKITINIQQQPRPPQQPRQSQPRQKRKSLQPRQGLLQGNSHSVQSVTSSVLQENKRLQQLAKKTKLQKKKTKLQKEIDDLKIAPDSAEILKNILSGFNRSPQTGPLKKQNSGESESTVSSLGLQDARASRNRRKQQKQKQEQNIQNLTSKFKDLHISPKQQSTQQRTQQRSSLQQSIRSYDLSNLQHQNSGHKKSQSRQTSSHISDPLYGFNQSNLPVDLGQEIQKILSKKQRKQR